MGIPKFGVWTQPIAGGGSVQVSTAHSFRTNESMNERTGKFEFSLKNIRGAESGTFNMGDFCFIKSGYGTAGSTLTVGRIVGTNNEAFPAEDLRAEASTMNSILVTKKVIGYYKDGTTDFSALTDESGSALSNDGTGLGATAVTSSRIIRDLLRQFALGASGTNLMDAQLIHYKNWNGTVGISGTTTRILNDVGSSREFVINWDTMIDVIVKLSNKEYAGKDHSFYVDSDWDFTWLPTEVLPITTTLEKGVNIKSCDFKYAESQLKNFFIINAGRDLNDSQDILVFVYDIRGITESGYREEYKKDTAFRDDTKQRNTYAGDNDGFIEAVTDFIKAKYQSNLAGQSQIKWVGTTTIRGSTVYKLGQIANVIHGNYWNGEKRFIIKSVRHTLDRGGWETQIDLEAEVYGR